MVNRPEECIMDAENMAYPSNINTYSISIRRKKGKREKGKSESCVRDWVLWKRYWNIKGLTCARRQHARIKDGTRVSLFEPINNQKSLECSGRFKLRLFVSSSLLFFLKDTLTWGKEANLQIEQTSIRTELFAILRLCNISNGSFRSNMLLLCASAAIRFVDLVAGL